MTQTSLVHTYPAHPSLDNSHIGRCIMFDFNSQQAMLTQATGEVVGNKWNSIIKVTGGFLPPTPAEWILEITNAITAGDFVTIDSLQGHYIDFFAVTGSPSQFNEFQIGVDTDATAYNLAEAIRTHPGTHCEVPPTIGSQIRLIMSVSKAHIGTGGNTWSIITTSSSVNYWIDVYGNDADLIKSSDIYLDIIDNTGNRLTSLNYELLFTQSQSGNFEYINQEYFPTDKQAVAVNVYNWLQAHGASLFDMVSPVINQDGDYEIYISANNYEEQYLDFQSPYPATIIENSKTIPVLGLVLQPYIGVLRDVTNGVATVDSSPLQELILGNSSYTFDTETNFSDDYHNKIITPYNDGKCIAILDLLSSEPDGAFFEWLTQMGTVFYSLNKIYANTPNQVIVAKETVIFEY